MTRTALTFARRALRIHNATLRRPSEHTRLIVGHALELIAVASGAAGFTFVFETAGIAGAAILLLHIITSTEA